MCWCLFSRPQPSSWVYDEPIDDDWKKHMWEPFDNEMGAPLTRVFTEDTTQEHAELRKQSEELSHYLFCQSMFEHKDENRRRSAKKIFAYHDVPLAEAAEKYLKKLLTAFSDDSERVNFLTSLKMNDEADEDLRKAAAKMLEIP